MQASLASQENNKTTIRDLETQVGQIAKKLVERQSGKFSANTHTNPKEHCNVITTRSGIVVGEEICDNLVDEEVRKDETEETKNKIEEEKNKIEDAKEKRKKMYI